MDHYLANKIVEDLATGLITPQQGWKNLQECREVISDEAYDEITSLIIEILLEQEAIEESEDIELSDFFLGTDSTQTIDDDWDRYYYQDYWNDDNNPSFNSDEE